MSCGKPSCAHDAMMHARAEVSEVRTGGVCAPRRPADKFNAPRRTKCLARNCAVRANSIGGRSRRLWLWPLAEASCRRGAVLDAGGRVE